MSTDDRLDGARRSAKLRTRRRLDRKEAGSEYMVSFHLILDKGPEMGSFEHGNESCVFHKRRRTAWLSERLLASQIPLCWMELIYSPIMRYIGFIHVFVLGAICEVPS
jgi:hypothetical protein